MPTQGNGKPLVYKVIVSGKIAQDLDVLRTRAKEGGVESDYLLALETAGNRLRQDPWNFGELIMRLPHFKLQIHVRVVHPLLIEFAIDEDKPLVYIKRVDLVSG